MKKLLFLFAALAFATACSNDDKEEQNPNHENTGVKILAKKIKKVMYYEDGDNTPHTYEFKYDETGRIKSCGTENYTYSDNSITVKNEKEKEEYVFTLENGHIKSYSFQDDKADFIYDDNYLAKVETSYIEGSKVTENFRFDGGNLAEYSYIDNTDKDDHGSIHFTYAYQLNNLNIDVFYFFDYFDSYMASALLFGLTGKRSCNLPGSMTFTEPEWDDNEDNIVGTETYTYKLDYKMTGEYISEITITDEDGEIIEIYKIEYEE